MEGDISRKIGNHSNDRMQNQSNHGSQLGIQKKLAAIPACIQFPPCTRTRKGSVHEAPHQMGEGNSAHPK